MSDERPRNEAAMADILASIRKIVADEDRRGAQQRPLLLDDNVLLLTPEMRVDADDAAARGQTPSSPARPHAPPSTPPVAPPFTPSAARAAAPFRPDPAPQPARPDLPHHTVPSPEGALSLDEATVADIARAVLREEFDGPFGRALTARVEAMVKAEVARALGRQGRSQE